MIDGLTCKQLRKRVEGLENEVAALRNSEALLRESEKKFSTLFQTNPAGTVITSLKDGRIIDHNDSFSEITGYRRQEILGRTTVELGFWPNPRDRVEITQRLKNESSFHNLEFEYYHRSGGIRNGLFSAEVINIQNESCILTAMFDITEPMQLKEENEKSTQIQRLINEAKTHKDLAKIITGFVRDWLDIAAVGVRIREGEVCPYFETRRFPEGFSMAETNHCAGDLIGQSIRDKMSDPVFECMCCNVIGGKTDPDLPFSTRKGSFWTNSTTALLATAREDGRQVYMRRCNGEGYESVALIPLRTKGQNYGFIQLKDFHKGRFTEKTIAMMEGISDQVAHALSEQQAKTLLKEREERYRALFDNMEEGVCLHQMVYDGSGKAVDYRILDVNAAYEAITEFDRHKAVGMLASDLYGTGEAPFLEIYDKVVRTGRPERVEGFWDPISKYFSISIVPTGTGRFSTIFMDISARKRAEQQRTQVEERLKQAQKMEAIGILAGGIAHDFNNILFPIIGYAEMIIGEAVEKNMGHNRIKLILDAAMRASDLVKQILTVSRQQEQELKPLKAEIIVKEALKLVRSSLPSSIEIEQNIGDDCGLVMADPTNIHQIIMNLCTNAYHAMEKTGGKLGLTLSRVELTQEDVVGMDMGVGPYLYLKVDDTGHGMEKEVMDRIFDPYFTTKEKDKGTGLGLAVVHGIVRSYGGEIRVRSKIGVGTDFQVFLPLIKTETQAAEIESAPNFPKGNEKILLVDDDAAILKLVEMMLCRLGYVVTSYTSSPEALLAFRRRPLEFDLVVTDMTMPRMTGDELAKEMIKVRTDIPIILCTGFSQRMTSEQADAMGIKGFLLKPIQTRILAKKIREVLDGKFPAP